MRIARIVADRIEVPLRTPFRHAQAEHRTAENVIVEVTLEDGATGYGNSLPRPFVTGESAEGVFEIYRRGVSRSVFGNVGGFGDLVEILTADPLVPEGFTLNLAARCALELALLDAFGKHFKRSASDAIRLATPEVVFDEPPSEVRYCVGISSATPLRELARAVKYRLAGFRSLKLKVGLDDAQDLRKLRLIRSLLGRRIDLHADANGAWLLGRAETMCREMEPYELAAIEQPLPKGDEDDLGALRRATGIPVTIDESLTSHDSARQAAANRWCDLFNIRISKCGGLLRSCGLARIAWEHGLGYQLGCQVGETGILSAAGRAFACTVRDIRYLEGSYDRWLIADNVLKRDISIGYGGCAPCLTGHGLGVEVDPDAVERLSLETLEVPSAS
jgi:muconate cycloisomerase